MSCVDHVRKETDRRESGMEQKKKQDAPDRESGRFKGDAAAAVYQDMDGAAHRYDDIIDLPHHVSDRHPEHEYD